MALHLRVVVANDLDELAIARAAAIGDHDFVIGAVRRPFSAESD